MREFEAFLAARPELFDAAPGDRAAQVKAATAQHKCPDLPLGRVRKNPERVYVDACTRTVHKNHNQVVFRGYQTDKDDCTKWSHNSLHAQSNRVGTGCGYYSLRLLKTHIRNSHQGQGIENAMHTM